jgi:sugar phosphate permease
MSSGLGVSAPGAPRRMIRTRGVLIAGAGSLAAISAVQQGMPALAPILRSRFDLGLGAVGLLLGAVTLGFALTMLPWGLASDRLGERRVICLGMTGAGLALVGGALARTAPLFGVCLFCAGLLGSSAIVASGRAIVGAFPVDRRAAALGLRQMAVPLGGAAAAAALPVLAHTAGLPAVFIALAATCFAAAAAAFRLLPRLEVPSTGRYGPTQRWRHWRLACSASMLVVVQFSLIGFLVVYLHERAGLSTAASAAVLVAVQVIGAVSRLRVGRWSDRRMERIRPLRLIALGTGLLVGLLAITCAISTVPADILLPVATVIAMSWNGLANTAAAEIAGNARSGAALGFQNALLAATGALAPAAFGALVQSSSWPVAFAALATVALAATHALTRVAEPHESARHQSAHPRSGTDKIASA